MKKEIQGMEVKRIMATQLIVDLYGCDKAILNDENAVRKAAHQAVEMLGAGIAAECVHCFEPIGVSYIAVITTSHFSIHTWPEYGYAAVDVFSCTQKVPGQLADLLARQLCAGSRKLREIEREVGEGTGFEV